MQQHASTFYVLEHTHDTWSVVKGQTIFFESRHVAYQIHIMSLHTPSTTGVGSKGQNIFLMKVVMLHIKLKGMEYRAPRKHIFCPYTHARSLG